MNLHHLPWILIPLLVIAGLGLTLTAPPASAASSYTWTSTADFDSGTKVSISNFHFATDHRTRALNDAGGPVALHAGARTYVTYQSNAGTNANDPKVTYYDHATGTWATPVVVGANVLVSDGHGIPCIGRDSLGRLHVFWGAHASAMSHSASTNADDISAWTAKADITGQTTYCHVETSGATMWLIYRLGVASNPGNTWVWRVSTDNGETFGAATTFLDPGTNHGMYVGAATERSGTRIHMVANWLFIANDDRRHNVYEFALDTGDGNVYSVGGTSMGATATLAELNTSARLVETYTTGDAQIFAVHLDSSGNPYVIYSENTTTGTWRYQFQRWTGSAWTAAQQITTNPHQYDTADFIVNSATSVEAFIAAQGDQQSIIAGDIERWTWDGTTWTLSETIFKESNAAAEAHFAAAPHLRSVGLQVPWVPVQFTADLRLLFEEFIDDNFVTDGLRIYGWGSGGFVPTTGDQGGPSVESVTDNTDVASGSVQLANGGADTFATADSDANTWKWNRGLFRGGAAQTINQLAIESGRVRVNITSTGTYWAVGSVSGFTVTSPDIAVNTNQLFKSGAPTTWPFLAIFNERQIDCQGDGASGGAPGTVDGVVIRYLNPSTSRLLQTLSCSDGVATQDGTNTGLAQTQLCLRASLSGTTWTTYYSTSSTCASWTQDETFTLSTSGRYYVAFGTALNGAATVDASYDDFDVLAGTLDQGGYRTAGSWTSPSFSIGSSQVVDRVILAHSGLSATAYINKVEIIRDGTVMETFEENAVSGSTTVLTSGATELGGEMQVRVTLAGDGAGTPVLEEVRVDTREPSPETGPRAVVFARCRIAWPWEALECDGWAESAWLSAVGGLKESYWFVDGQRIGNGSRLTMKIPEGWWSPVEAEHEARYVVISNFNVGAASDAEWSRSDQRFLWLIPILFVVGVSIKIANRLVRHYPKEESG